jgi:excisionase family DNA binding protein
MSKRRGAKESPIELLSTRPTVSVTEAAVILSISRGQAYAMANRGDLRVVRIGTRLVIPTDQLRELIGGAA